MKKYSLVFFALINFFVVAQENKLENKVQFNFFALVSSSSKSPAIIIKEGEIEYVLGFQRQDGRVLDINKPLKVIYKSTQSIHFKTEEGLTIENTYADLKNYSPLKTEPGWGHYVELPSGWWAVFFSIENPKEKPKETDKITFFCKKFR